MQQRIEVMAAVVVFVATIFFEIQFNFVMMDYLPQYNAPWWKHSFWLILYMVVFFTGMLMVINSLGKFTFKPTSSIYPNGMFDRGFWGFTETISLTRSRHIIFWLSVSPFQTHRLQSVAGAIQYHDHKRLDIISQKKWFHQSTFDDYTKWVATACMANNSWALHFMIERMTHTDDARLLVALLSPVTPYAYHEEDIEQLSKDRLTVVEQVIDRMDADSLTQAAQKAPILNELWSIYDFPLKWSALSNQDIDTERRVANIAIKMAKHPVLHDFLTKWMAQEQLDQDPQSQRSKNARSEKRLNALVQVRQEFMAEIMSVIQSKAMTDVVGNVGATRKKRRM